MLSSNVISKSPKDGPGAATGAAARMRKPASQCTVAANVGPGHSECDTLVLPDGGSGHRAAHSGAAVRLTMAHPSVRTVCEENEFSTGPVWSFAHLIHEIPIRYQAGLNLLALAKAQGGVRRQHLPIREDVRSAEAHQRQADLSQLHPTLHRPDARHVRDLVGRSTVPFPPALIRRIACL